VDILIFKRNILFQNHFPCLIPIRIVSASNCTKVSPYVLLPPTGCGTQDMTLALIQVTGAHPPAV